MNRRQQREKPNNLLEGAKMGRWAQRAAMKTCLMTMCFAALAVSVSLAQQQKAAPPPPKPADDGPSLEVTMKFIREKMAAAIKLESPGSKDVIAADPTKCEFTWTQRGGSWYGPTFIPSVRKTT